MKILDWFKKILSKSKKDYMLNVENSENEVVQDKKEFVPKVKVNNTEHKKSREDIIRSLRDDMIVEDLSEQYNYTKFSPEEIREKYDMDHILSDEDMTALSCLYEAIKDGNMWYTKSEWVNGELKLQGNQINNFLKKSPDNIIVLINLMHKYARNFYESLGDKKWDFTTVQGLIPSSYDEISQLSEEHIKECEIEGR